VAGTEKELFMPEAVHEIFKSSNGTPRLINILCDRALITGYSRDLNRVSPEMIRECAKELDISSDAEATDIRSTPQIEKPPAIEETADQAKAFVKPFRIRHKWIAASVVSAVAFLLFGVFFTRIPENNRAQESASTERQNFEIRQSVVAEKTASSGEWTSKSIAPKKRRFLLFFKPNSAELEDSSYEILRQVSDFLSANPNSEVTLTPHLTQNDRPGLSTKLLALRATSIKSVLAAQPKFKGKITVIDSYVQGAVEDQELAGSSFSKPWAEIRIEPGAKGQRVDLQHTP
jgi:outer membrane protein OmpA-like peptidoglycan-associated protein